MSENFLSASFQPTISHSDWITLINILATYQHNHEYRAMQGRMLDEARRAGIPIPDALKQQELENQILRKGA